MDTHLLKKRLDCRYMFQYVVYRSDLVKCHRIQCSDYSSMTTTQYSKMMFIPIILKSTVSVAIIQDAVFN